MLDMASKESSTTKDHNTAQERKCGKRKTRPRHRFTKDDLEILKQSFKQNPYPSFTTKEELANQLHCQLYVINNWFQDRRYRLPPREKKRIFAIWKLNGFCTQRAQSLVSPSTQAQSASSSMKPASVHGQETLVCRASQSSLETQSISRDHVGSGDAVVTSINVKPGCPLEYQGIPASGPSSTSTPANFTHPNPLVQYFGSARYEAGKSQHSLPICYHYVCSGQGTGQQEEQKSLHQCSEFQGQWPNHWGYHLRQLPQPQYYQENYHLLFQDQLLPYQNPGGSGQQEPKLPSRQRSHGGALSSLLHQAPPLVADRTSPPLGQERKQTDAELSRSEVQHPGNGVSPGDHC